MKRNLGRMRNRITVFDPVRTDDGALGHNRSNTPVAILWANIKKAGGSEIFRYQHLDEQITHKVTIRYDARIKQGQYFEWDNRQFYIEVVTDPDELKRFLELICREGGNL